VIDPHDPTLEKVLAMSVRKAEGIVALLKAGKTLLDIQKIGSAKDSQFIAIPL
jgi:phosphoheptose isomerase